MKRVDRLYIQVQRAYGQHDKQLSIGLVNYLDSGEWEAIADLWDGKEGSHKPEDRITSTHATMEDAIKAIEAVAEAHKPLGNYKAMFEDVPIIINDIGAMQD